MPARRACLQASRTSKRGAPARGRKRVCSVRRSSVIDRARDGCGPFGAIAMRSLVDAGAYELPQTSRVAEVTEKRCTSCKLCEQVCIKDAIEIPRVQSFRDIGMSFMSYLVDGH